MKKKALFILMIVLMASCAHQKNQGIKSIPAPNSSTGTNKNLAGPVIAGKEIALFHLISPLKVELYLRSLGKNKRQIILLEQIFSRFNLSVGSWQIVGLSINGRFYDASNKSGTFIFTINKNKTTYVGSYIVQCPQVGQNYFKEMKKMSFFNRYYFTSENTQCELVVGNNYNQVNKAWQSLERDHQKLGIGI